METRSKSVSRSKAPPARRLTPRPGGKLGFGAVSEKGGPLIDSNARRLALPTGPRRLPAVARPSCEAVVPSLAVAAKEGLNHGKATEAC